MNDIDDLSRYLASLDCDACYRVDAVYKEAPLETTERVFFRGENGAELGPFVRKLIDRDSGLGGAYETLAAAQARGVRLAHLPRIVEYHRTERHLVVVMEHVAGETLSSCVAGAADSAARLRLVRRVFPDLCDAVIELHERLVPPIVHRDLKPGNVMVSEGGVTLIDLGIAREYKEGAPTDTMHFGTRAYAPPEQFGFGQTSVQSDVYALGMLLFFCLTGREPAPRDREAGFAGSGLPEALREVVVRATRLDPAARQASVRGLRSELVAALDEVPDSPSPQQTPLRAQPRPAASEGGDAASPDGGGRAAVRGQGARGVGLGALLARVPRKVGTVWNLVVFGAEVILVAGCVMAVAQPSEENASWPAWYLYFSYYVFLVPSFLTTGYLLLDRRPLRKAVPVLASLTVRGETKAGVVAVLGLFAAWALASMVAL